jgi:hypothetical protein
MEYLDMNLLRLSTPKQWQLSQSSKLIFEGGWDNGGEEDENASVSAFLTFRMLPLFALVPNCAADKARCAR